MNSLAVASSLSRKANKTRMLVVDDEPDNLDLLYRTFRRDFSVLRAESGQQALDILAQHGEVAVIISDQRMPEMKGTEFLSKTVPEFPDTVRIILTGFTDVEDLVEAINAGQVYRYITKPWDPDELKNVVGQAAKTYELLKQRGDAIQQSQSQHLFVITMAEIVQSATDVNTALPAISQAIQSMLQSQGCIVHLLKNELLGDTAESAGNADVTLLKDNPLVEKAITEKLPQFCTDISSIPSLAQNTDSIRAYCVAPVIFRDSMTAVISIQWESLRVFSEATQDLVKLAAKQTGLTLACYER